MPVSPAAGRGRAGHRHLVPDPDALIPEEHQVRLRPEDEVGRAEQLVHGTAAGAELARREPGDEQLGQRLGIEPFQVTPDLAGQLVAEHGRAERGPDRLLPGELVLQHVLEQFGQVEHLHAVVAQRLSEDVMLLLRPRRPRQPGERQLPAGARDHSFQLGARPVHDDGPEPSYLAVYPAEPWQRPPVPRPPLVPVSLR